MAEPMGKKVDEEKTVRVTIENKSDKDAYIKFTGPHHYYFVVGPNSKATYTPLAGEYDYLMIACGVHYKEGVVDLQRNTTYSIAACGTNAYGPDTAKGVDVNKELKIIPMTFTGKAFGTMVLVLTGPQHVCNFTAPRAWIKTLPSAKVGMSTSCTAAAAPMAASSTLTAENIKNSSARKIPIA